MHSPLARWVYLINELACTVNALSYNPHGGVLGELGPAVSTLPPDWPGAFTPEGGDSTGCTTADIHCSRDGCLHYLCPPPTRPPRAPFSPVVFVACL